MTLAFSQACENNKQPILAKLSNVFSQCQQVLEIGSGTGQHAVHFAKHLPHLNWFTSDLALNHHSIEQRIAQAQLNNLMPPLSLDLNLAWQEQLRVANSPTSFDAIFTANTLHIVSWPLVEKFFFAVGQHLSSNGTLCIYGPFNYHGQYTSESNQQFDLWLKARDINSAIRNIEQILEQASLAKLVLSDDHEMPANNRLLVFKRIN